MADVPLVSAPSTMSQAVEFLRQNDGQHLKRLLQENPRLSVLKDDVGFRKSFYCKIDAEYIGNVYVYSFM